MKENPLPEHSANISFFKFLEHRQVAIMQGTGGESTSYYTGTVDHIELDAKGNPTAIFLENRRDPIPYADNITSLSIIGE